MPNIRLPDPLTNAGAPGFTSARLIDNNPVYRDRLPGGKVVVLSSAAQYWGVILSYEELLSYEYNIINSAILRSKLYGEPIEVLLPHKENYNVSGNPTSTIISAGQKGSVLSIRNYTLTGTPKEGDLLKLTNHCSKVYTIISSALVGSTLTLELYPNLFKTTTGNEKPIFNNILFQLVLENPDTWDSTFTPDSTYSSFQVELAETITYD